MCVCVCVCVFVVFYQATRCIEATSAWILSGHVNLRLEEGIQPHTTKDYKKLDKYQTARHGDRRALLTVWYF